MSWTEAAWRRRGPLWWLLLRPLSGLYRLGWALAPGRRGRPQRVGAPVISVGNLSVGGTGKSPVVRLIAARAAAQKRRPAILLRGYGAQAGPRPLQVSAGKGPLVGVRLSGDEAQEHSQAAPAQVWVDADRRRGAQAALAAGAGALVLDDGFQRRHQLARDLDLLLVDYQDLRLGEHLLPAGPWREPWSQAAQADALLLGSAPGGLSLAGLKAQLPPAFQGLPLFTLKRQPAGLRPWPEGPRFALGQLKKRTVLALSGLGRPQAFEDSLRALGANPVAWRFPDHHRFSHRQLERPPQDAEAIVTTAKDAARLPLGWRPGRPVWILELRAQVEPEREFWKLVDDALKGGG